MSEIIFKPIGQVKTQSSEAEIRGEGKDLAGELEIYAEFEPALHESTAIPISLSWRILTGCDRIRSGRFR